MRRWRTKFQQNYPGRFQVWLNLILYIAVLAVILIFMSSIGDKTASCFTQISR
ncbi:MAG: hypothetical protein FJ088_08940 [Deltaproteobacteria bacterium]|nr:hypothetical protein [Deltaproteobacteria bacterium]